MKRFINHMLETPNITLTAFIIAFFIAIGISVWTKDWNSAVACFLAVSSITGIKYYAWTKQDQLLPQNKAQKVIVIKRK